MPECRMEIEGRLLVRTLDRVDISAYSYIICYEEVVDGKN